MSAQPQQRVIIVTGASRGLGLEWIKQLKDPKHFVVGVVRSIEKSDLLHPLLDSNTVAVEADLADPATFEKAAKEISALTGGRIDVLINNAGIMTGTGSEPLTGPSKSTIKEWELQYQVNVVGPVFFTNALLPQILAGREKKVINIGSMLADLDFHRNTSLQFASYSSSKAALTMATLAFHLEFKNQGLIFVTLNPGWVATEMDSTGNAPLKAPESIRRCLIFVNKASLADGGKLLTLEGKEEVSVQ